MSRRVIVALAFAATAMAASFTLATDDLELSWRLIGNHPENAYDAELEIHNAGDKPLEGEWALYFNSSSSLVPQSVEPAYRLEHVNGDFYRLGAGKNGQPILPGERKIVRWRGTPWALNTSDAPGGFYLVHGDRIEQPAPLSLTILPFPAAEKLRRGAADAVPLVTADSRFAENESLSLLPAEELSPVTPTPTSLKSLPGDVAIDADWTILFDGQLESEAGLLADWLNKLLTSKIQVKRGTADKRHAPNTIRLRIGEFNIGSDAPQSAGEAYRLIASAENGIEITGSNAAGVFYGIQSLRSLLPIAAYRQPARELRLEAVEISDSPRFRYRGMHLDVARNFQRKETVLKLLDLMAFYKLNRLHWHLTDDEGWRIEIPQLPELTMVGARRGHSANEDEYLLPSHGSGPNPNSSSSPGNGFYTQQDLIEILRYARQRHITVIPEIDLPGHARAAIKSMQARSRAQQAKRGATENDSYQLTDPNDASKFQSIQGWRDNVVDPGRDDTYRFLKLVVDELASIYNRAGAPLTTVHLGGDEVPKGAWDASPACNDLVAENDPNRTRRELLEMYFFDRSAKILRQSSIQPACWDDCLLWKIDQGTDAAKWRTEIDGAPPIAYSWNNVWGWGREDAAYRLANAGVDVVLCNATHLYFDLACEKDPLEPGYYWAGFVSDRKPFEFVPLDVYQNADQNSMGQPVDPKDLANRTRLTADGVRHVLGIQGHLWGENLRDARQLEYMAFPRLIALAERAWAASPHWTNVEPPAERRAARELDWNQFANRLGQRELPRLDWLDGGVHYRIPPPGLLLRDGKIHANVSYPGLQIRYASDGSQPNPSSPLYEKPVAPAETIHFRTFNSRGRSGRSASLQNAAQ